MNARAALQILCLTVASCHVVHAQSWTRVSGDGFDGVCNKGSCNTESSIAPAVFAGCLYFGTSNPAGAQMWRSCDGVNWQQLNSAGFDDVSEFGILQVFDGCLYTSGVSGNLMGAAVYAGCCRRHPLRYFHRTN